MTSVSQINRTADLALDYVLGWLDRYRLLMLGAAGLWMIAGFNGQWRLEPDSAMYAQIARNVIAGAGYTHATADASRALPGIVGEFALDFLTFGHEVLWPLVLAMMGLSLAILGLSYRLISVHADRGQAVAATCLLAINSVFYRQSLGLMADLPFLLGLMAFLVGYEQLEKRVSRHRLNWALIVGGLIWMAAFKITVIVVLGAWLLAEIWNVVRAKHRLWRVLVPLGIVGVLVAGRLLVAISHGGLDLTVKEAGIVGHLWQHPGVTFYKIIPTNTAMFLTSRFPEAVFGNKLALMPITVTISLIVVAVMILLLAHRVLWGLLVLGYLVQWLCFLPTGRYTLALMPLIAFAWWRHAVRLSRYGPSVVGWAMFVAVLMLWVAMNVGRSGGVIITQHRQPFYAHYEHGRYESVKALGQWLAGHTEADARVFSPGKWTMPLTFYSQRTVEHADDQTLKAAASAQRPIYRTRPADQPAQGRARVVGLTPGPVLARIPRSHGRPPIIVERLDPESQP